MDPRQDRAEWLLKKYENRRIYDTQASRYVTLDEVADGIRRGADPRIQDARTGADLTQATLAQIIVEGRGASRLLPVPLLLRLIRMEDDVLADFLSRFLITALDMYQQTKAQVEAIAGVSPLGAGVQEMFERLYGLPFADPKGRGGKVPPWAQPVRPGDFGRAAPPEPPARAPRASPPPAPDLAPDGDALAELRRELRALKESMGARSRPKKPRATPKARRRKA